MNFDQWRSTGRAFSPADAEAMFGWGHPREDIQRVYVYTGPEFIEVMDDDTVLYAGVAMEDLEMAEEASFAYYASQAWRREAV